MKDPMVRSDRLSPFAAMAAGPLAERLAHAGGVNAVFMRKFIKEVMTIIEEGLWRDGEVNIHNFGTFRLRQPQVPAGGDANIGKAALAADRPQVVFRPSKRLRELVNLSLGATISPGSRISLQALLEKHLQFPVPPAAPRLAEPAPDFDIVETFPEVIATPRPAFVLAEDATATEPAMEELKLGEAIPQTASKRPPTFTFAETVQAPTPAFAKTEEQTEPPLSASRRRSPRVAWYGSAAAVFLLLLLFLLSGRISEKSASVAFFGADTASTPVAGAEQSSPQNVSNGTSAEPPQSAAALSKPSDGSAAYFAGGEHRVAAGDNLWGISGTYYRDYYLWPNIYRVNMATIPNPDILQIDQALEVPPLYGPPDRLTAADRRNLAEGYFLLYRYYKESESSLAPYALWAAVQYEARIKTDHATELSDDDLAFLQAHAVRRAWAER